MIVIGVVHKYLVILFAAYGRITLHPLALYDTLANEMGIEVMYGLRASVWLTVLSVPSLSYQGSLDHKGSPL